MAARGSLSQSRLLTPSDLAEIEALEREVAAEGIRLKLEWLTLSRRDPMLINDFLWRDAGALVGFLGLYRFGPGPAEICGMVHPLRRREGIFTSLLEAALLEVTRRNVPDALLVVDRASQAAAAFARSFGAELAHSEYSMTLRRAPAPEEVRHPELVARPAVPDDGAFVRLCIGLAFEGTNDATRDPIGGAPLDVSDPDRATVIFELAGSRVGMVAISHSERGSYISGFSMLPECRGRGFGRQMLARVVGDLLSTGYDRISLEVATSNDRALELYRTNGFEVVVTLDYYNVPL